MHNNVLNYLKSAVNKAPDKIAYSDGEHGLTFQNVYDISRSIGSFLAGQGQTGTAVAVYMKKSPEEIAAFFGVITAGSYYVPIDEEMPLDRIHLILDNSKPGIIICDDTTADKAKDLCGENRRAVCFSEICDHAADGEVLDRIFDSSVDTDPVYIVFTSGSTGIPKGVVACHRSVIDYIEQLSETLGFNEDTIFGNQAPLYFDACLKELYPTLKFCATDYLIPRKLFSFPTKLMEYLNEHKINTVCWVASAFSIVSSFNTFEEIKPECLKTIAFGSEVFPVPQLRKWREAVPDATFFNLYGPTECTGMSCYYRVNREFEDNETIPIGKPFDNTSIILLKDDGTRAGTGEDGEICIRGTAVTLGYFGNPGKTKEAFVQNPLNDSYPEIIYKTGDIGRYNDLGELVYVSRKDYQIKHMGHRIELGEIEVAVNSVDGINMSACVYDSENSNIILYYVGSVPEKELEKILKEKLPKYMIPRKTIKKAALPRTGSGKIDRKTLLVEYKQK